MNTKAVAITALLLVLSVALVTMGVTGVFNGEDGISSSDINRLSAMMSGKRLKMSCSLSSTEAGYDKTSFNVWASFADEGVFLRYDYTRSKPFTRAMQDFSNDVKYVHVIEPAGKVHLWTEMTHGDSNNCAHINESGLSAEQFLTVGADQVQPDGSIKVDLKMQYPERMVTVELYMTADRKPQKLVWDSTTATVVDYALEDGTWDATITTGCSKTTTAEEIGDRIKALRERQELEALQKTKPGLQRTFDRERLQKDRSRLMKAFAKAGGLEPKRTVEIQAGDVTCADDDDKFGQGGIQINFLGFSTGFSLPPIHLYGRYCGPGYGSIQGNYNAPQPSVTSGTPPVTACNGNQNQCYKKNDPSYWGNAKTTCPPIDEFDKNCMIHDRSCLENGNTKNLHKNIRVEITMCPGNRCGVDFPLVEAAKAVPGVPIPGSSGWWSDFQNIWNVLLPLLEKVLGGGQLTKVEAATGVVYLWWIIPCWKDWTEECAWWDAWCHANNWADASGGWDGWWDHVDCNGDSSATNDWPSLAGPY